MTASALSSSEAASAGRSASISKSPSATVAGGSAGFVLLALRPTSPPDPLPLRRYGGQGECVDTSASQLLSGLRKPFERPGAPKLPSPAARARTTGGESGLLAGTDASTASTKPLPSPICLPRAGWNTLAPPDGRCGRWRGARSPRCALGARSRMSATSSVMAFRQCYGSHYTVLASKLCI